MKRLSFRRMLLRAALVLAGLVLGCHLWAYWYYRAAQQALARHDPAAARSHLERCLKVWLYSAETHLLAARAARQIGDFEGAKHHLRECQWLGGSAEAVELENTLLRAQRGGLPQVESYLIGLVQQGHPDTVPILEVLTPQYLMTYQINNALECVQRWLEREPDRVQAWVYRAQTFERYTNEEEALASYQRILELDPENTDARLAVAALLITRHPHEALEYFKQVRRQRGEVPAVLGGMARCHRILNHPEEARQLLDAFLGQQPRHGLALIERGQLALQTETPEQAETWFRRALEVLPFEKEANYGLYRCLQQLNKPKEAEEVLAKLERIEVDLRRLHQVTREIAHHSHDPDLRCQAGRILLRNGQETEGLRWFASALLEDPHHPPTHLALAEHYQRVGDAKLAARHRQLAAEGSALRASWSLSPRP